MRRGLGILGLLGLLASCTSEGETDLVKIGRLAYNELAGVEKGEEPPEKQPTRAELDRIPFATIAVSFEEGPRSYVVPVANHGGYLTFYDERRRALILYGGAIAGTQGQPYDLLGVRHSLDDPVAYPRPLAEWPGEIDREYQFLKKDQKRFSITLRCTYRRVVREMIEIVERRYEVVRIEETCTNARRQVTNTYWVAPETGRIWRSVQWAGPQLPNFVIEIIRPFRG